MQNIYWCVTPFRPFPPKNRFFSYMCWQWWDGIIWGLFLDHWVSCNWPEFSWNGNAGSFWEKIERYGYGSASNVLCSRHVARTFSETSCRGWWKDVWRIWKHACGSSCIIWPQQNSKYSYSLYLYVSFWLSSITLVLVLITGYSYRPQQQRRDGILGSK